MGTPLGPKYIPYTYMDPLGKKTSADVVPRLCNRRAAPFTRIQLVAAPDDAWPKQLGVEHGLGFRV